MRLPLIDFSGVDPSAPGAGTWPAVRAQVTDALATTGCFDARYPALTPRLRAALFDGSVRPLFALPADAKRRNSHGADKPFHGYLGSRDGAYESLAIVDGAEPESVAAFADLMWPDGGNAGFSESIHGAAKRMLELEEVVQRMVLEGLGVAGYHDALSESSWHLFRMWEYKAKPAGSVGEKEVRYGEHQDANTLTVVCQHEVEGLEVRTPDGECLLVEPSPASLVVMAGNALRAWTNDRLHAPFHHVTVGGDATRYSAILFSIPKSMVQAPDELVDDEHPSRFKPYNNDDFIRFCVSEEATRHKDKLKAYCEG